MIPRVLTIGASDSSGAAGIQADLKTFEARQVYGLSAIVALTAQNSLGIQSLKMMDAQFIGEQIRAVAEFTPGAVKTGLLLRSEIINAVADGLAADTENLIVDPVLVAGDARRLVDDTAIKLYRERLIPCALLIMPNIDEAQILTGLAIGDIPQMREAAQLLYERDKPRHVLIKGGHLSGETMTDVFYDGTTFHELSAHRLPAFNPRGAGDAYASCIAAEVAGGLDVLSAARIAKKYVTAAIRGGLGWQMGSGPRSVLYHSLERPPLYSDERDMGD